MKNNKMLFLCPSYPAIGGVEAVTSLLVDYFLEKGFEVFILVSGTEKVLGSSLDKHLNLMTTMKGRLNSAENLAFIDHFIGEKDIACVFNQGIFSQSYLYASLHNDVLFINTLHSCPFWEVKKFRYSKPGQLLQAEKTSYGKFKVLVRFVLNKIKPGWSHPFIVAFYRKQIDSVSYYVVLDQAYKTILEKRLYGGVKQEKIKVIPDPLALPEKKLFNKQKKVLYVGRLTGEPKRVDRLLRIWKRIQQEISGWELLIVGDGDQRENLEEMSDKLQLENVSFLGYASPVPFYESADILCLTSTYEGFGMVLTEAQSYGVIPVSFRCSEAIGNIIDHGVNGMIVEYFDEEALAKELLIIMKDDFLRASMSRNAIIKATDFNIEKIGQTWLDLMGK